MKKILISTVLLTAGLCTSVSAHDLKNINDYGQTFAACYAKEVHDGKLDKCSILTKGSKCTDKLTDIIKICAERPSGAAVGKVTVQIEELNNATSDNENENENAENVPVLIGKAVNLRNEYMNAVDRILMAIMDEKSWEGESILFNLAENTRFYFWVNEYLLIDPEDKEKTGEMVKLRKILSYTQEPYPGFDKCVSKALSMTDMYDCNEKALKAVDAKINSTYKKLMSRVKDKKLKDSIKDMERKWIRYKEAAPELIVAFRGGSLAVADAGSFVIEETMKQTNLLERLNSLIR